MDMTMTKIAILRSDRNSHKCPLTSCFKCLRDCTQGFAGYENTELVGVFTLAKEGQDSINLAKILKAKGAEAVHVVTCAFSSKSENGWTLGQGLEQKEGQDLDRLLRDMAGATGLPFIKGTAHLPQGYAPERF